MWPKYGTPLEVDLLESNIPDGTELDIASISAQGVLFNVKAVLVEGGMSHDAYLDLYIDGSLMATVSQVYDEYDNPLASCASVLAVIYRSSDRGRLIVGITREVSFRSTLVLKARNQSGEVLNCEGKVHYYVVT